MSRVEQLFLELEEGQVTLTRTHRVVNGYSIDACQQRQLNCFEPIEIGCAIGEMIRELGIERPARVHVALADRRFVHLSLLVPQLSTVELRAVILRDVRREGNLPAEVELLIGCRHARRVGRRHQFAVVALPASVWAPIGAEIERRGLEVASLTSIEDAMAAALPDGLSAHTALVDCGSGRLRFVLSEHGIATHVRRILVPGWRSGHGDDDSSMMAAQLAMEVPRTLEYLDGLGATPPDFLLLSHQLDMPAETLEMVAGDIPRTAIYTAPYPVIDEGPQLGMATYGLMHRVQQRRRVLSLLDPLEWRMPRSRLTVALGALVLVLWAFGGAGVVVSRGALGDAATRLQHTQDEVVELEQREAEVVRSAVGDGEQQRLRRLLSRRRPISLMISELCNAVPPGVSLNNLKITPDERVAVDGVVHGGSRRESLQLTSLLMRRLRELPFFGEAKEDIFAPNEVGSEVGALGFRFVATWRHP